MHGRGGQGVVTASLILAQAAFEEGFYAQAIPFFGFERRGAPVMASVRIDRELITIRAHIRNPDCVMVMDHSLLLSTRVNVFEGLKGEGVAVINAPKPVELKVKPSKLGLVDATGITMKLLGTPLVGIPMLGAFSAVTGAVGLDSVIKAVKLKLGGKAVEGTIEAVKEAYQRVEVVKP